jgi:CHAD domain-containing protein
MPKNSEIHTAVGRRVQRALRAAAKESSPENVHRLRTSIRRAEVLLAGQLPASHKRVAKLQRELQKLRRRAGKVRDMDVQLNALRSLDLGRPDNAREQLTRFLKDKREKRAKKLESLLDSKGQSRLRRHLSAVAEDLESQNNGHKSRNKAVKHLRKTLEKVLRSGSDPQTFTEERLHDFRMQCKRARYAAEQADEKTNAQLIDRLKQMQDAIGTWHDWLTLGATARKRLGASPSPFLAALRNITQSKLWEAVHVCRQTLPEIIRLAKEANVDVSSAKPPASVPSPKVQAASA